jgi:hypothetical protein
MFDREVVPKMKPRGGYRHRRDAHHHSQDRLADVSQATSQEDSSCRESISVFPIGLGKPLAGMMIQAISDCESQSCTRADPPTLRPRSERRR